MDADLLAEAMLSFRAEAVARVTAVLRERGLPPGEIEGERKAEKLAEDIVTALFGSAS